jgi:hypothetical protein
MIQVFVHFIIFVGVFGADSPTRNEAVQQTPPVFEIDLSPGEGRPVIYSVGKPIILRARPRRDSPVTTTLSVRAKTRLTLDSTRFQTIEAGLIRAIAPSEIRGRNFGPIKRLARDRYYSSEFRDTVIAVSAGDTVVYLQDRAEGTCFLRASELVIDAEMCPHHFRNNFEMARAPSVLWWVYITHGGKSGWLLLEESSPVAVDRTF